MNIVEVNDIKKNYGDKVALNGININIDEGIIYGILGPNGSGKSTLINIISGLVKFNSGSCRVFNKDIKKYKKEIQKNISVVTQEYSLYDDLKAKENVELFARLSGIRGNLAKSRVEESLNQVNLLESADKYPSSFSGGMKRRLNIACALVNKPKLLIMDEPTASLDPISRDYIINTIENIKKEGTSIIYTSHYLEEIEKICEKITIINNGNIVITDYTRNIIERYKNRNVIVIYLGKVYKDFEKTINTNMILKDDFTFEKDDLSQFYILKIFCNNTSVVLQRALTYLNRNNIYIKDIFIRESTLEEVFFKLIKTREK